MGKTAEDPLVAEIRNHLKAGQLLRQDQVSTAVAGLEKVHQAILDRVRSGNAVGGIRLYEILLAGVYAKIEETDDDWYLYSLFRNLMCGWIRARQAAKLPARETVDALLHWMANDQYGMCHDIEADAIKALNRASQRLFLAHFHQRIDSALAKEGTHAPKAFFEYGNEVRLPALSLRLIYEAMADVEQYAGLCEQLGFTPRDCQRLANMESSAKRWEQALGWVEKGLALQATRNWHNEDAPELKSMRPKILGHLGRTEDALSLAWADFQQTPNEYAYGHFMRYVPKAEKAAWRQRALEVVGKADLGSFLPVAMAAEAWDCLPQRVHAAAPSELEALSHFVAEPAAMALEKRDPLAAAKLRLALGLRIVNAGKSKYYGEALNHLAKAERLFHATGHADQWAAVVAYVRTNHSRKTGFLSAFLKMAAGERTKTPSYAEEALARWKKMSS